jgi:hypothetical protein
MTKNAIASIDILWMDIQGAELKALIGLKDKITAIKIMHIEVEFIEIYSCQPLFKDIRQYLVSNGFVFLGFTSKSKYFADAVFANNCIYKQLKNKNKVAKLLI